jgi:hypothetical protein
MSALALCQAQLPRLVRCGCGQALWSEDIEELLVIADTHVRHAHPELVGTLSPLELAQPKRIGEEEIAA